MTKQGHEEETGKAKITSGYNLPAKYILHTVGPIISRGIGFAPQWSVSKEDEGLLASCYREFLNKEDRIKKVIFNVFKDEDLKIYSTILS